MNALANVLMGAGVLVFAIAVLVIAMRGFRRLEASIGKVHVVADAVNHAVNNVGEDEPTLRQMVAGIDRRLTDHVAASTARLDQIEELITRPKGGTV